MEKAFDAAVLIGSGSTRCAEPKASNLNPGESNPGGGKPGELKPGEGKSESIGSLSPEELVDRG